MPCSELFLLLLRLIVNTSAFHCMHAYHLPTTQHLIKAKAQHGSAGLEHYQQIVTQVLGPIELGSHMSAAQAFHGFHDFSHDSAP